MIAYRPATSVRVENIPSRKKTWFGVDQETTYELRFFSEILDSPRLDPTYIT